MGDQGGQESVDVALALLADQGFDATLMAQMAEATGIPAEEVVRTLGTKDSIVLTVARDMLVAVVDALAESDPQTPLVEALGAAHAEVCWRQPTWTCWTARSLRPRRRCRVARVHAQQAESGLPHHHRPADKGVPKTLKLEG